MTAALYVLATVLVLAGVIGCVLPVIPGPPLAYLALLVVSLTTGWTSYGTGLLVVLAVLAVGVTVLDYVLPAAASRRTGGGRGGSWGAVIGMILGLIFFPPFGVILGAFVGAVVGELVQGKDTEGALRAGWGVFLGVVLGIGLKLAVTGVIAFYTFREVIAAF